MSEHRWTARPPWEIAIWLVAVLVVVLLAMRLLIFAIELPVLSHAMQTQAKAKSVEVMKPVELSAHSQERIANALEILATYEAMRWGALTPAQADARVKKLLELVDGGRVEITHVGSDPDTSFLTHWVMSPCWMWTRLPRRMSLLAKVTPGVETSSSLTCDGP